MRTAVVLASGVRSGSCRNRRLPQSARRGALLERRNRMETEFGLALWMRYTRLLLDQAEGLPLLVASYDEILEDPESFSEQAHRFLKDLGMAVTPAVDRSAVREFIDPKLRHSAQDLSGLGAASDLYGTMMDLHGTHDSFVPPRLGSEAPWIAEQLTSAGPEWRQSWNIPGEPPPTVGSRLRGLVRRASSIGR